MEIQYIRTQQDDRHASEYLDMLYGQGAYETLCRCGTLFLCAVYLMWRGQHEERGPDELIVRRLDD